MKLPTFLLYFLLFSIPSVIFAATPPGKDIKLDDILNFGDYLGNFLYTLAGSVLVSIFIIWAAVKYLTAGADSNKVGQAKSMLIAALLGALVIFGVGIITATIKDIATGGSSLWSGGVSGGNTAACLACVSPPYDGLDVWCIANSTCMAGSLGCPGLYTGVPEGCYF